MRANRLTTSLAVCGAAAERAGFRGRTVEAIPVDRLAEICKRHGAIPK